MRYKEGVMGVNEACRGGGKPVRWMEKKRDGERERVYENKGNISIKLVKGVVLVKESVIGR